MDEVKKFACHRIYQSADSYQGQSVVSINTKVEVVSFSLFDSEACHTEWIGGAVLLSNKSELYIEKDFSLLLSTAFPIEDKYPLYAWHLSPFDFENETLLPQCVLRKLH